MPHANAACKATAKPCQDLAAEVSGYLRLKGEVKTNGTKIVDRQTNKPTSEH